MDLKIALVETKPHPEGPYGAKGIGEPGMAPTAAAIAFAVSNAVGKRFTSMPIKADDVLLTLKKMKSSDNHRMGGE
jgi:CO/xanthine dehydrogenase Mo-binding subunit